MKLTAFDFFPKTKIQKTCITINLPASAMPMFVHCCFAVTQRIKSMHVTNDFDYVKSLRQGYSNTWQQSLVEK